MGDSIEKQPLRDICKEAERLTRELVDHLENNLLPRTRELHDLVHPDSPFDPTGPVRAGQGGAGPAVADITVRNQAASLLESQRFTEELFLKTSQYLRSIDRQMAALTGRR